MLGLLIMLILVRYRLLEVCDHASRWSTNPVKSRDQALKNQVLPRQWAEAAIRQGKPAPGIKQTEDDQ